MVDFVRRKQAAAAAAIVAVMASALLIALWPAFLPIACAEILHSLASSALGPAIAALSLALVDRSALGERLGDNVVLPHHGSLSRTLRLDAEARRLERFTSGPSVASVMEEERHRSHEYGGRSVFGIEPPPPETARNESAG